MCVNVSMCVNMCVYACICVYMCVYMCDTCCRLGGGVTRVAYWRGVYVTRVCIYVVCTGDVLSIIYMHTMGWTQCTQYNNAGI